MQMRAADENMLVEAARGGDASAYEQLFEAYHSKLYNYAYGICGNTEDAKDIAQDAFIRVFEALPRIEGELKFSAYLYRTAHNAAIDSAKARSRFDGPEELEFALDEHLAADPERVALLREQQGQVRGAAFALRDEHREILTLRELEDMSYEEIGAVLDMPKNTVGVLLSRARLKFKGAFRMSAVDVDKLTSECKSMLPLISAYIDDELSNDERASVEAHLAECPLCRLAMEEMTEASKSYRGIIPLIPPAALRAGVLDRLAQMPHGSTTGGEGQPASEMPEGAEGGVGGGEPAARMDTVSESAARRVKKSAKRRGAREALKRFIAALTPTQKALIAIASLVIVAGTILGVVLGLTSTLGPDVTPRPAVTDVRPGMTLQPTSAGGEKSGSDVVEDPAVEEEPPPDETDEDGTSAPSTEPTTAPPDDSQLGDQPGDVNLPDETTHTYPDY